MFGFYICFDHYHHIGLFTTLVCCCCLLPTPTLDTTPFKHSSACCVCWYVICVVVAALELGNAHVQQTFASRLVGRTPFAVNTGDNDVWLYTTFGIWMCVFWVGSTARHEIDGMWSTSLFLVGALAKFSPCGRMHKLWQRLSSAGFATLWDLFVCLFVFRWSIDHFARSVYWLHVFSFKLN